MPALRRTVPNDARLRWTSPGARALVLAAVAGLGACASDVGRELRLPTRPRLTHGIAIGDVTATGAVLWGRCDQTAAALCATVTPGPPHVHAAAADEARDRTATIPLTDLPPATRHDVRLWCAARCDDPPGKPAEGAFRTAPVPDRDAQVRFAWSGDLGGQNVCRDRDRGYPIFDAVGARAPDFFVGLGDMVYADSACAGVGQLGNVQLPGPRAARGLEGFRAHWRYNRDDPAFQRLLAQVPYVGIWDDHEVRDDFGPGHDRRFPFLWRHLLGPGRQAFVEYTPLTPTDGVGEPRLYRQLRWGRGVELFVLDTRSFRDSNRARDDPRAPKSLLGGAQRAWLEGALPASDARWKVVVSSVPMSIPTGSWARDGWAGEEGGTGFEQELLDLLRVFQRARVRNLLWITTDVHFATGFRYRPFADDADFVVYEVAAGPLSAGLFPRRDVDSTLAPERLFSHGPTGPVATLADALRWFNFGVVTVDAQGRLTIEVVDGRGETVARLAPGDDR